MCQEYLMPITLFEEVCLYITDVEVLFCCGQRAYDTNRINSCIPRLHQSDVNIISVDL